MTKNKNKYNKLMVYQCQFSALKTADSLTWEPSEEVINEFFIGFDWKPMLSKYLLRKDFYWGFELRGESDIHPILEARVVMELPSLTNPGFCLEVSFSPNKIDPQQRAQIANLLEKYQKDDEFLAFWDDFPKEPGDKGLTALKKKLLKSLQEIPEYQNEDNLTPDDCDISPDDALTFFGFEAEPTPEEFKVKLREFQLKHHPDAGGDEESFKKFQKYRKILEEFVLCDTPEE